MSSSIWPNLRNVVDIVPRGKITGKYFDFDWAKEIFYLNTHLGANISKAHLDGPQLCCMRYGEDKRKILIPSLTLSREPGRSFHGQKAKAVFICLVRVLQRNNFLSLFVRLYFVFTAGWNSFFRQVGALLFWILYIMRALWLKLLSPILSHFRLWRMSSDLKLGILCFWSDVNIRSVLARMWMLPRTEGTRDHLPDLLLLLFDPSCLPHLWNPCNVKKSN